MRERIDEIIKILQNSISNSTGPEEYNDAMSDKEVNDLLRSTSCTVDALTLVEIIEIIDEISWEKQLSEGCINTIDKINAIGGRVQNLKGREKQNAYRWAAGEMGWTSGKKEADIDLLNEYLDLIGRVYLYEKKKGGLAEFIKMEPPEPMERESAIEYLVEKYGVSYDAIFQRIKRAKKNEKKLLKSQNEDFSHLINILPTYIDNSGPA